MAVFRVERNTGYTVMSNHHLRNKELSLKAKGLLSQMLSLPEDWDYSFESLSILGTCREAVEDNLTLLEEAGFSIEYTENDYQVISDKKGLMFILGQIISNSVKYVGNNLAPRLIFSIADSMNSEQISLSIKDNGTSIPLSDLPFVFDKGFTGDTGSYLSRSTGMGLYLVQKMATDLFITVELKNNSYGGTTVTLTFPKV